MSDQLTANYSGKGMQKNLLEFSAKLEQHKKCCENFPTVLKNYSPSGSTDPKGNIGNFAFDTSYLYIKTVAGWLRTPLSSF